MAKILLTKVFRHDAIVTLQSTADAEFKPTELNVIN